VRPVQGLLLDPPTIPDMRAFAAGIVAPNTTTLWPGLPIVETDPPSIPLGNPQRLPSPDLGNWLTLATSVSSITGFTITAPESSGAWLIDEIDYRDPVPIAQQSCGIQYARLGCGLRIIVAADPSFAQSLSGVAVNTPVTWDFTNQRLTFCGIFSTALPVLVLEVMTQPRIINASGCWSEGGAAVAIRL